MASIQRFEDMDIWQDARILAKDCYRLSLIAREARDYELGNTLPKTSGFVMDNIAEGFGRGGNKEFTQFLSTAFASCLEVKSQLYRLTDRPYFMENLDQLFDSIDSLKNRINGFMIYLKKSDKTGYKFMETQGNTHSNHLPTTNHKSSNYKS